MLNVKIEKNNEEYRVKMKGHCNFAKEGKDIVCAAASILCVTLGQVLQENKNKLIEQPYIKIRNGQSIIIWKPKKEYEHVINNSLYTIVAGFRVLEHHYPDYIKIKK